MLMYLLALWQSPIGGLVLPAPLVTLLTFLLAFWLAFLLASSKQCNFRKNGYPRELSWPFLWHRSCDKIHINQPMCHQIRQLECQRVTHRLRMCPYHDKQPLKCWIEFRFLILYIDE